MLLHNTQHRKRAARSQGYGRLGTRSRTMYSPFVTTHLHSPVRDRFTSKLTPLDPGTTGGGCGRLTKPDISLATKSGHFNLLRTGHEPAHGGLRLSQSAVKSDSWR